MAEVKPSPSPVGMRSALLMIGKAATMIRNTSMGTDITSNLPLKKTLASPGGSEDHLAEKNAIIAAIRSIKEGFP